MKDAIRDGISNHATKLTQLFHGEGLLTGTAEMATEIGIKHGRKRKSDPGSWKINIKKQKVQTGENKD